jgi:prevent-host-death family protein
MTPADVRDRLTHALRLDLIGPDPDEPQVPEILNPAVSVDVLFASEVVEKYAWTYCLRSMMARVPAIIPVTDLRQDAAAALKRARDSRQPVVITQRGRAAAVLVSIETYKAAEHERELLRLLAKGDREIAAGKGHDLDSVLADADELLARE